MTSAPFTTHDETDNALAKEKWTLLLRKKIEIFRIEPVAVKRPLYFSSWRVSYCDWKNVLILDKSMAEIFNVSLYRRIINITLQS